MLIRIIDTGVFVFRRREFLKFFNPVVLCRVRSFVQKFLTLVTRLRNPLSEREGGAIPQAGCPLTFRNSETKRIRIPIGSFLDWLPYSRLSSLLAFFAFLESTYR